MATGGNEDEEELISKGLYRLVSDIIGPEVEVKLRRERWRMMEWMENNQWRTINHDYRAMHSGSTAEGFQMETSDIDMMYWSRNTVVVENYSQFIDYQPYFKTVLMIDNDYTSPGFTMVKCITSDVSNHDVTSSFVWKCGEHWVSSKKFMEYYLQLNPSATAHGPCQSGVIYGWEYDNARCLKCAFWPQQASSAISRMRRCGWPPEDVIQEMIKDGCLLVPVASKKPLFEGASDLEWRTSFSLAEKRLIYAMNHCQFLCYGLWKLFLSEVLKKLNGIEDLLCSYFLKTVVFWEIYKEPSSWTPTNFISKFHATLRLLASLVSVGYCPNFFRPENNMFYGKICVEKQRTLMSYLRSFINEGFLCLLKSESLHRIFLPMIENPVMLRDIPTDESVYLSSSALRAMTLFHTCCYYGSEGSIKESLHELCNMSTINVDSDLSMNMMWTRKCQLLQNIAERTLHEMVISTTCNRYKHSVLKFGVRCLQNNKTYFAYNELVLAITFYGMRNYAKSVKVASTVKSKLQNENIMYTWTITEERVSRNQTRDLTDPQIIQQYVASRFVLHEDTTLHELYPEIQAHRESIRVPVLHIPPLVLAYFLLILSHHKMNDVIQMYDVLRELHVLVHHGDNFHIKNKYKAISWEILGICEQLYGDYSAAYNSYINALNDRYNEFKSATLVRINSLQFF